MFLRDYARKKRLELIKPYLRSKDIILDVGCGDKWLSKELKDYSIISLDTYSGDIFATATTIPFKNNSFDVIILIEVLEHVDCMIEIKRVLKSGGKLIVTIPNQKYDWITEILISLKLIGSRITPHINKITCKDIKLKCLEHKKLFCNLSEFGVFVR